MKRNGFIVTIYLIAYGAYILFMHLIGSVKGLNYWIGFCFMTLAFGLAIAFTVMSNGKRSFVFPLDISMVVIANIYLVATLILTVKYGKAILLGNIIYDLIPLRQFLINEFILLLIFVALFMAIGINRKHVLNNDRRVNKELWDRRDLISKIEILIEKAKTFGNHKALVKKLENLIDDIKFCNIDSSQDNSLLNEKIEANILKLEKELNNVIEIDTTDYSSIDDIVLNIREQLIKKERRALK